VTRDNQLFETVRASEVPSLARTGALWSGALVAAQQVVRLLATIILARLLLPSDYGLVGMATVLTAFVQVFSDAGLASATIQRDGLRREQVHNLFWLNVALGLALSIVAIALAPGVSWFFGRNEITAIIAALGLGFALSGPSVQPLALLKRQMRFKALALIEVTALAVAAITGIVCAASGAGYWSLVIQSLMGSLARTFLAFVASGYRPRAPRMGVGTMPLISFGSQIAAYGLLVYLARNLDNALIGKFWGPDELGYYGRAYYLMLLPSILATSVAGNVMVPALSRLQADRESLGAAYRQAVFTVWYLSAPLGVLIGFFAPELVRLVYGPQWNPVAPVLSWLAVAAVTQGLYNSYGWLYTAVGDGRGALRWGAISVFVLACAFVIGINWGAKGIAISYAVSMGIILPLPALYFAHKSAKIFLFRTINKLIPIVSATLVMAATIWIADWVTSVHAFPNLFSMIFKIIIGCSIYSFMAKMTFSLLKSKVFSIPNYPQF
jgi:PST family polysaccharide transporter